MSFDFSRTVSGRRHRRELRAQVSLPNWGAYEGSHILERLETRALMDATLSMSLGVLYGADGNPLADNRAIVILVDAEGDGFGSHDSGTSFSTDSDDVVLTNTIYASNSLVGIPGVTVMPPLTFAVGSNLAGKPIKVLWFDKDVSQVTVAGGPGAGVQFGTYRTDAIQNGSDIAWFVPADGTTSTLNFLTNSVGGESLESDGEVKFTTGGSGPVNQPPVLATIGNRTTAELANLTFVAGASDPDAGNALTFSLDTASIAAGMTINSATGQFNWTPSEQQGPGLFNVTITVTDNGSPAGSDSETFSIQVSEQNAAPVLAPIGSQTVAEGQSLTVNLSATDSDLPANGIMLSVTGLPDFATFTNNGDGTGSIIINPGTTDAGNYNIQVTATDNGNPQLNDSESFVLTVTNFNVAPIAVDDSATTAEDTALDIAASTLTANDTDIDGNPLTITSVGGAVNGTVSLSSTTITFTPAANFSGSGSFSYTVSDGNGGTDTATVNVTITAVNDAPIAIDDAATTAEDTALNIAASTLTANDTDIDGGPLTITSVGGAGNGTVSLSGTTITFTPTANFVGSASFTYTVSDGNGGTDTATVTVTITAVNDAPIAIDDAATTAEDTAINIAASTLTANDTDIDGNPLAITSVGGAVNGTVSLSGSTITFTPAANFAGSGSFTYTVSDGNGGTDTATVNVAITAVNDAPVASDDSATTSENLPVAIAVLPNDTDVEGNTLTVISVSNPARGSAVINANGTITYTPNLNLTGIDTFTYTISDGNGGTDTATVTVDVGGVNDAPVAANDSYSINEDGVLNVPAITGVLANDSDVDGDTLSAILVTGPSNGSLTLNANGSFTYISTSNFNGSDSFTYSASDGSLNSGIATVSITVTPVNDAPDAVNDSVTTAEDTALNIAASTLAANDTDIDGGPLTVTAAGNAVNGTVNLSGTTVTFTPAANFVGSGSFTYTISDGNGGTDTATVNVTVTPVNDAPVAADDSYTTGFGQTLTVNALNGLLANDSDPDNDTITVVSFNAVANGDLNISADGSFVYAPNAGFSGTETISYTISDGLAVDTATLTITVQANGAPVAADDSYTTGFGQTLTVNALNGLLANDSDPDNDAITAVSFGAATNGDLTVAADGSFIYIPNAGFSGAETISYTISDGFAVDTATLTITVRGANNAPAATDDSATTDEDTPVVINLLSNDSDQDDDSLTVTAVTQGANGSVVNNGDGTVTYAPAPNFFGSDTFTYTVSDGNGGSDTATVTVTINPVNDAPVAADDAISTDEDTQVAINVLSNDSDIDGGMLFVSSFDATSANGGTITNDNGVLTYTPAINFNGSDAFSYTISDGNGGSDTATVTVTISAINDAPVAAGDTATTVANTPVAIVVLANDSDLDGDTLNIQSVTQPASGSVVVNPDKTITYTPTPNFSGNDSFTYTVSDDQGGSATATVNLTVNASVGDNVTRRLSINDVKVREGNNGVRLATFTIRLSAASSEQVTVDLATADGTAIAGLDYNALAPTTVTFAPGQTSAKVTVEVLGDTIDEDNQTFFVNLTNAVNATIFDNQGVATIKDDDAAPKIFISNATGVEGGTVQFEVTLSSSSERIITVNAATVSAGTSTGIATAGIDYSALNTSVTFNPGETSAFVTIDALADGQMEENERFSVILRNASNGRISDATGIGTIVDGTAPTITISDAQVAEPVEGTSLLTFDVNLSEPAAMPVSVKFTAPPGVGAGKAGIFDIRPIFVGTVTFEPGQTTQTIDVQVKSDQRNEADETVTVTLLSSNFGTITDAQGVGTIIDDDEAPTITLDDVTVVEAKRGRSFAIATVSLSKASGYNVTVDVQTADGSATAGEDYSPVALTTLSFLPGQTRRRVIIPILNDRAKEAVETFAVNLSNATHATIARPQGIVTIQDND